MGKIAREAPTALIDEPRPALRLTPHPPMNRKRIVGSAQQERFWDELVTGQSHMILEARAGTGKCLAPGTPVMKHDGSAVPVESIRVGDRLMGPDSQPRTVLCLSAGFGPMFRIVPTKGTSWACNGSHVLTLRDSVTKREYDLPLPTYLRERHKACHRDAKLFRVGVDFPRQDTPQEPYLVGVWIGDGSVGTPRITNPDPEILEYVESVATNAGFQATRSLSTGPTPCPTIAMVNSGGKGHRLKKSGYSSNAFADEFDRCVVDGEKRIPREYLINSRESRLAILAGLVDSDGYLTCNCYEITTKHAGLRDDILFLARSLGFSANATAKIATIKASGFEGLYWRIVISGHVDEIPCRVARKKARPRLQKKDVSNTGFVVDAIGDGPFFGFTLDGDGRFLLGDFTVTHNSTSCREGIWRLMDAFPGISTTYVAFNKAIAAEFKASLPPGAVASTMHGSGFAAIRNAIPNVGEPSRFKMWDIIDGYLPRRDKTTRQTKNAVVRLAQLCKGYLLNGTEGAALQRLAAQHGVNMGTYRSTVFDLVPRVLAECLKRSSIVDFSDMTWLPVMLDLEFPECDVLFVDEAQDLDPCQHALVRRIAGAGRMVVVGDPYQAIYGFRGADTRSLFTLGEHLAADKLGLVRLPLTMTRRCPASHVALAQQIVPDFEALPEAPKGSIEENASPDEALRPGVMALCRTNAPLVAAAYRLIGLGIPVAIQGKDLGDGLAKLVESFCVTTTAELMDSVQRHRAKETDRLSALDDSEADIEALNDQCTCIMAASTGLITVNDVVARVRSLFLDVSAHDQSRYVLLSSIHRAKGRESEHVAILCPELLPHKMARTPEAMEQERNLAYVATTRSKNRLSFLGPIPDLFKGGI